jgi:hypothetical protein
MMQKVLRTAGRYRWTRMVLFRVRNEGRNTRSRCWYQCGERAGTDQHLSGECSPSSQVRRDGVGSHRSKSASGPARVARDFTHTNADVRFYAVSAV